MTMRARKLMHVPFGGDARARARAERGYRPIRFARARRASPSRAPRNSSRSQRHRTTDAPRAPRGYVVMKRRLSIHGIHSV